MGNFEKLIVLVVLFAAAVVLALNFTGGDEVQAPDPLAGAEAVLGEDAGRETETPGTDSMGVPELSGLLNAGGDVDAFPEPDPLPAGLQPAPPAAEPAAPASGLVADESDPTRRILLDTVGLRPSFLDEYMVYRIAEGDTWTGLAQRFYQDGRYTRNLMQANDDLADLAPGTEILVPVHDVIAADPSRSVAAAEAPVAEGSARPLSSAPPTTPSSAPAPKPAAIAGEYVVQPGDTLSDIALAAFGSASRWKDILAANQDKLQRPESLRAGMKLAIPAGGKVPSGTLAAHAEKKPEAKKASSAVSATSTTTTKKKKVL